MPGLISRDLTTIRIDRVVLEDEKHYQLYRTTIAHEAAHSLLHRDFYSKFSYANEEGWIRVVQSISEKDFKFLEWQAESLGSLICVPRQHLKREVQTAYQHATQFSKNFNTDQLTRHISQYLTKVFVVTPSFIRQRINQDGLLPPPPESLPTISPPQ